MKCDAVQQHLLTASSPETPPAPVQYHLAVCTTCRLFQHQLLLIEQHVPLLAVPRTDARQRLLRRLERRPAGIMPGGTEGSGDHRWTGLALRLRDGVVSHPAVVIAVAASVMFLLSGWLYVRFQDGDQPGQVVRKHANPDALVANLLKLDLQLAHTQTPAEKVQRLAKVAAELSDDTQRLARILDISDVRTLAALNDRADWYCREVEEGVLKRAADLPAAQRREVLQPIAEQLVRASEEAEGLAREKPTVRAALEKMAAAARKGDGQLRGLLKETP